jgi:hypothetical protein
VLCGAEYGRFENGLPPLLASRNIFEGTGGAEAPTENQLIIKQGKSNKSTRV